jgi:hypothetical protein
MDGVDLAQDMDQGKAFVNTVMNLGFRKMLGKSWIAERLATSQGLSSMELVSLLAVTNTLTPEAPGRSSECGAD